LHFRLHSEVNQIVIVPNFELVEENEKEVGGVGEGVMLVLMSIGVVLVVVVVLVV
jgi:hypothetical protein